MSERLSLWWHNNVKRHWHNFAFRFTPLYREWIAQGRDPRMFPRSGKITPEVMAWAKSVMERRNHEQPTKAGTT